MSTPSTMNAWVLDDFGEPEVFEQREQPVPEIDAHQVLLRVHATSVNPVDYKIRRGDAAALCPPQPAVLHGDVAGTVEAVGAEVSDFAPGDAVYGCAGGFPGAPTAPWPTTCPATRACWPRCPTRFRSVRRPRSRSWP